MTQETLKKALEALEDLKATRRKARLKIKDVKPSQETFSEAAERELKEDFINHQYTR